MDQKTERIDKMRELILDMAMIIRNLDHEGNFTQYWLQDANQDEGVHCIALDKIEHS